MAEGPDGAIYVGQLTGFPFFPGAASVFRISSDGGSVTPFASGFTAIVDITFDAGGALYVLEVARGQVGPFPPPPPPDPGLGIGRLKRQRPGASPVVLLDGLTFPGESRLVRTARLTRPTTAPRPARAKCCGCQ